MNTRFFTAAILLAAAAVGLGAQTRASDHVLTGGNRAELSEAEIEGLLLMREEEKLARDVYLTLGDLWNLRVFGNIAESEQVHMDRVAELLEAYGIEDPIRNESEVGVFADPVLARMFTDLVESGSRSAKDALEVGKDIEVLDIEDLEKLMAGTDEDDILRVYGNLLRGSENHLAAFTRQLSRY